LNVLPAMARSDKAPKLERLLSGLDEIAAARFYQTVGAECRSRAVETKSASRSFGKGWLSWSAAIAYYAWRIAGSTYATPVPL
jgi:hypothetical protein